MAATLSLTEQLQSFSGGDRDFAEAILREVLPKLHQIAVRELHRERYIAPLSPTELINEVWYRNIGRGGWKINSREHFYAISSLAMRRVLVDFARARLATARGKGEIHDSLEDHTSLVAGMPDPNAIVQMGMLMERLEKVNAQWAMIVDMHYFVGYTLEEIADNSGLTRRQVRHLWNKACNWLKDQLADQMSA